MKALIITTVFLLTQSLLQAQGITGTWQGFIDAGGAKLRFIMELKQENGKWQSSFSSPDQKVSGIPGSKTEISSDSVTAEINLMRAVFKGKWNRSDLIKGNFQQGAFTTELNLSRRTEPGMPKTAEESAKPQTPKPPFGYDTEEVEYDNADHSVHYGATLTKPRNLSSFPTVIIISGSGSQDRDGTIMGHKVYWVLADYLTNHGIAVLRVDDRGVGKSTLGPDPQKLTSAVFSTDVEASLNYLLLRKDVDSKRIGLIGHSEGGIIAPMVAARRKEISFTVLWGAPAVGGRKINVEQNLYSLRKAGIDSSATAAFGELHNQLLEQFSTSTKEKLNNTADQIFDRWKKNQSPKILQQLMVGDSSIVGQNIHSMYHGLYDLEWMRYFISYEPAADLAKIKCPVLAVTGEKDTQVDARENLPLIENILRKGGNKNITAQMLPSLNHLFQTAVTGDVAEYAASKEIIAPSAMALISDWINSLKRL
jgi:pimeloyl-ACP methyl ester carboxylesterase